MSVSYFASTLHFGVWGFRKERKPAYYEEAHHLACEQGDTFYKDPKSGKLVMTAHALEARGYCCGNGCRHCPYR